MDDALAAGLRSQDAVHRVLARPKTMELLGQRLIPFCTFTERFLLHGQRPWRVDEREVRGVRVGVV